MVPEILNPIGWRRALLLAGLAVFIGGGPIGSPFSANALAQGSGPVNLAIKRAVRISFPSKTGERYQLYRSTDATNWIKEGGLIEGTGAEIALTFLTDDGNRLFFRAETEGGQPVEVVKTLTDFKEYKTWRLVRTLLGPDPFLGGAHGAGSVFRDIYVSPADARRVDGQFPAGTVFLKQLRANNNGTPGDVVDALTVMVKRGGGYNREGNGWDYFMTDTALTQTLLRGGSETMCHNCHVGGKDLDFVFSATALEASTEVVKTLNDFKDYKNWKLVRTLLGPDPFLGGAHGGGSVFRDIFVSPADAKPVNGQFPAGTVFLKQLRANNNGTPGDVVDALTVMVKRGGGYNREGNGWDYFMTDTALTQTLLRGGNETMCHNCHVGGKDLDFVFSATALQASTEVVKTLNDFKDYKNWKLVRTLLGPDPFLGGAHGGGSMFRDIFVSPADAKPVNGQFPAGTVFLKQLRANNNGTPGDVIDALTVMVKRGGGYNREGSGWDYFMTDTALTQTLLRGGNETMCHNCHVGGKDLDFVFSATTLKP